MPDLFNLHSVTIGADPELFVGKRNEIISGHTLPIGTKQSPRQTTFGHIQVDGMAVEVNVRPSCSKVGFLRSVSDVIQDLERAIKVADPEMYLICKPTARFTDKYLETIPSSAKELGCNPDWNAYELAQNPRPNADTGLRTAGGHIHVGWGAGFNCDSLEHIGLCAEVAKQLDYTVGIHSLEWDRDTERRELYGKAGSFRPKPYGMEYRVLSPMWLLSVSHTSKVYDGVFKALTLLNNDTILDEQFEGLARSIIDQNEYNWRDISPELEKVLA